MTWRSGTRAMQGVAGALAPADHYSSDGVIIELSSLGGINPERWRIQPVRATPSAKIAAEAEGFARSGVEFPRDAVEISLGVALDIGAVREVLPEQPVGVLVGAALPRTLRVADVHRDIRGDREARMLHHLVAAWVSGDRRRARAISSRPSITTNLAADRRRRPSQYACQRPHRLTSGHAARDLLPFFRG